MHTTLSAAPEVPGQRVKTPQRVVIGEDDVLLREGIVRLLVEVGFDVVAQAGDADIWLRKGLAHRPDVVIADINMPTGCAPTGCAEDGLNGAMAIRQQRPEIGVLIPSQFYVSFRGHVGPFASGRDREVRP